MELLELLENLGHQELLERRELVVHQGNLEQVVHLVMELQELQE